MVNRDDAILALDQATSSTGWAFFINGELEDYGIFRTNGHQEEKIEDVRYWLETKIQELNTDYTINLKLKLENIQL